jgi:signal transduction histidine kinase
MMDTLREERTIQEAQHFFLEKLIDTSPTGIVIMDFDQRVQQLNPKAKQILGGGQELFFKHIADLKAGESQTLRLGNIKTYKVQKSNFIDRGFPRFFVMIEELTAEIAEAEKNTYSKVIRMMAHEVNNTVGPVNSIINLALSDRRLWLDASSETVKRALGIAVDRNDNLNIFMRNFADLVKLMPATKERVDAGRLVENVVGLMQVSVGQQSIDFVLNLPGEPYYLQADVQQMEQALLNIAKNAIEAIEGSGTVSFSLDPHLHTLTITDTGKGIPPMLAEQVFSPFFSTKKDGQGIGLTLVREILLNHGFQFSLNSAHVAQSTNSLQTSFVIQFRP